MGQGSRKDRHFLADIDFATFQGGIEVKIAAASSEVTDAEFIERPGFFRQFPVADRKSVVYIAKQRFAAGAEEQRHRQLIFLAAGGSGFGADQHRPRRYAGGICRRYSCRYHSLPAAYSEKAPGFAGIAAILAPGVRFSRRGAG